MRAAALLAVLFSLTVAGCSGPEVDLTTALQVVDAETGWFDAGVVDGKNKLVPSITFKIKNVSDQTLPMLQVNALFRRVSEPTDEWGSSYQTVSGTDGLAPGATSDVIVAKSGLGYTGTEPRQQMLQNKYFVDATVDIFTKYGSQQWVKLVDKQPIAREVVTR